MRNTLTIFVDAVTFVFFLHPFVVGDVVVIDDTRYFCIRLLPKSSIMSFSRVNIGIRFGTSVYYRAFFKRLLEILQRLIIALC